MVEKFLEYQNLVYKQKNCILEKEDSLLQMPAEINGHQQELEMLTVNTQDLKKEYSKGKKKNRPFPLLTK